MAVGDPGAGSRPAGAEPRGQQRSPRVALVGDSLLDGAAADVRRELTADGWSVTVDAVVGRGLLNRVPGDDALDVLRDLDDRHEAPDVLVVELGTNDLTFPAGYEPLVAEVMDHSAAACIVWVSTQGDWVGRSERLVELNEALRRQAAGRPWVAIADWEPVIGERPSLHAADGLHLTPRGYRRFADLIADTVDDHCAADGEPLRLRRSLAPVGASTWAGPG
ncbi:MAG: SGNH/GDSL hydrolase family protein [Actinomycetota bacterium]|nr:SGNH/GDSL hydrolase family protein [Actinomycetota bacterium]